jgi:hypothetical protein
LIIGSIIVWRKKAEAKLAPDVIGLEPLGVENA